jgi:hypothetical protein
VGTYVSLACEVKSVHCLWCVQFTCQFCVRCWYVSGKINLFLFSLWKNVEWTEGHDRRHLEIRHHPPHTWQSM